MPRWPTPSKPPSRQTVAANLAAAREVLPILEERIRAKFTPALNTGTPMDALVLVAEAIRELKAELTPSEDRS